MPLKTYKTLRELSLRGGIMGLTFVPIWCTFRMYLDPFGVRKCTFSLENRNDSEGPKTRAKNQRSNPKPDQKTKKATKTRPLVEP